MKLVTRGIRCALFAAIVVHGVVPALTTSASAASKAAKKEAAPAAAPANPDGTPNKTAQVEAAKRAYEGGVKAYGAGKYQNAIDQLSVALRGGGLGTAEMAKGLYYRGLAYKKLSKPGLAISDLTSALWLKNGLNDTDRANATAERAEAYKAAGVAESSVAPPPAARVEAAPAPTAPAPVAAAPAPTAPTASASAPQAVTSSASDGGFPQPLTMGAETAAPATPRYARTDDKVTSGVPSQSSALEQPYATDAASAVHSVPAAAQAPAAQPVLSAAPMDQAPAASTSVASPGVGSAVSGFFSNLFGSSTSPTQAPAAVQTASTTTTAPVSPQTSSWQGSSLTQSSASAAASKPAAAAVKPAAAAPAPVKTAAAAPAAAAPKIKGGKYKLHIAAVRSRAEADALAQKLMAEHGQAFASRTASVDEAVIGSMGKFYRVRVGSYATPDEPRGVCNTLRTSGYDCLVVSN